MGATLPFTKHGVISDRGTSQNIGLKKRKKEKKKKGPGFIRNSSLIRMAQQKM